MMVLVEGAFQFLYTVFIPRAKEPFMESAMSNGVAEQKGVKLVPSLFYQASGNQNKRYTLAGETA